MNKILIIVAILFLVKPVMPLVSYVINYDHIANELCENRSNPALECNGKCQLKKELAKASDNTNSATSNNKGKAGESEILFLSIFEEFHLVTPTYSKKIEPAYSNFYNYSVKIFIFHPPSLI